MERRKPFCRAVAIYSFILALGTVAQAQYGGGSGTPENPYLITTPEQMNAIGADPNDWDKHFKLMADIDLSQYTGTEFNIIGREVTIETYQPGPRGSEKLVLAEVLIPFAGTFDGDGHTISNFTYIDWDAERVGLFGYVADPNAGITNLELCAPHVYVENVYAVGALIGRFEKGAIVNCHIREAVVLGEGILQAGTIAGVVVGGVLTNCRSDRGMVLGDDKSYGNGSQVGGLIGYLDGGTLTDCCVDGGFVSGISCVGGLIGSNGGGAIENCWATATVTGDQEIGGLVGLNYGTITNSHTASDVWGETYVGGLVGYATGPRGRASVPYGYEGSEIDTCYATGMVVGTKSVGGLAGGGRGPFTHCYASGDVQGESEVGGLIGYHESNTVSACYATGRVTGERMVGGLVGRTLSTGGVTASYATGDVQGTEMVGGLAGMNWSTITACYATAGVAGEEAVGGLVGENKGEVIHCYSTGSADGDDEFGGLVGRSEDKNDIILCFWDTESSGLERSEGGVGKTTSQLQMARTFLGWGACAGERVWTLDEGNDYPKLWWEHLPGEAITFTYPTGTGSAEDPYRIYSGDELNRIGLMPCEWDKHFVLMADIDLRLPPGETLHRIGREDRPFRGVFDGNGYLISNLSYTSERVNFGGLFGYVDDPNAEIRNVTLVDPNVVATTWGEQIGGLVGYLGEGTVTDCQVLGGRVSGGGSVGVLVGHNEAGTILRCQTNAVVEGWGPLGGLAGRNNGMIRDSRADGRVRGSGSVGGLVGWNGQGCIVNCAAAGAVTDTYGYAGAGGLVGSNGGTVRNSYATGDVAGERYVGGLTGGSSGTLRDCYSTGAVAGVEYVGGLAGHSLGVISHCFATGATRGDERVGGLVGWGWSGGITESLWDVESTGQSTSVGGTGKTMAEMQVSSTFVKAGWDFVGPAGGPHDVWAESEVGAYPVLWWQLSAPPELPRFSSGAGQADDPYVISTAEDLNRIGHNAGLMAAHFKLASDLDLTDVEFYPIGDELFPFGGVFEGNGHVIANFNYRAQADDAVGLFAFVAGARITAVGLIAPEVDGGVQSNVGALISRLAAGLLTDCHVVGGTVLGVDDVGGLVGNNDAGAIIGCSASTGVTGGDRIGGLIGTNQAGEVAECYAAGTVAGQDEVGGLVGRSPAVIRNCYASGDIVGDRYVGGLVGMNNAHRSSITIVRSYATGQVAGQSNVGGLVGSGYGEVVASIWDVETSGQVASAGGTGLTTSEMQTAAPFLEAGWDFVGETANGTEDLWWIDEGRDYPRLWWESADAEF